MDYDYRALGKEVVERGINMFDSLQDWTKGAFSLANLGEEGREIFLYISRMSSKFKQNENNKIFTRALNTQNKVSIGTFIWMCQQAGIDTRKYQKNACSSISPVSVVSHVSSTSSAPSAVGVSDDTVDTKVIHRNTPAYIPIQYVEQSFSADSDFLMSLFPIFKDEQILFLMENYYLGATKDKSVIFWQIDITGKVRTGKIMKFNPITGKRIHEKGATNWMHYVMKQDGRLNKDFNLVQCLFGEHLLHRYPYKTVAVVEAEKTAIICAAVFPQYVWISCGSLSLFTPDRLQVLRGRKVIAFPDTDPEGKFYALWKDRAKEIDFCDILVSDLLEKKATPEEKEKKIDIADWVIKELRENPHFLEKHETGGTHDVQSSILKEMIAINPAVAQLIDQFDLLLI